MNFQEAVKYMRETGKTVAVTHGMARGKEYRVVNDEVNLRKLQCKPLRNIFGGEITWKDVPICNLLILEELLSYNYEPCVVYMSFTDAVKLIQADLCLTFTRKYYQESFYNNGWGREQDSDDNNYLVYTIDDGKEGAGIRIYNASHKEYYSPAIHDILASDWYIVGNSE